MNSVPLEQSPQAQRDKVFVNIMRGDSSLLQVTPQQAKRTQIACASARALLKPWPLVRANDCVAFPPCSAVLGMESDEHAKRPPDIAIDVDAHLHVAPVWAGRPDCGRLAPKVALLYCVTGRCARGEASLFSMLAS